MIRRKILTRKEHKRIANELSERLGIPKTTPESLPAYIATRKDLKDQLRRQIFQQPGVAEAITTLQKHRLSGGELLDYLAHFAGEIPVYWKSSNPGIRVRGGISFPSAQEARRASVFSKKVRCFARDVRRFQSTGIPIGIVLGLWPGKTEDERKALAETIRSLPAALEIYADYLLAAAGFFRPKRGRRGQPSLDSYARDLVQGVLKTLDEACVSTYGVLEALAVLIGAAYTVAGFPRRVTPKTLRRLLDENGQNPTGS